MQLTSTLYLHVPYIRRAELAHARRSSLNTRFLDGCIEALSPFEHDNIQVIKYQTRFARYATKVTSMEDRA